MENCIFCKIVEGIIPSYKVYEDENILAFLDISQTTKGHTLVIPKKHVKDLFDLDNTLASDVFANVPMIANALKDSLGCEGMNIVSNNNIIAGQSVFHFHIHLIPRYSSNDTFDIHFTNNMNNTSKEVYLEIAEQVKTKINR